MDDRTDRGQLAGAPPFADPDDRTDSKPRTAGAALPADTNDRTGSVPSVAGAAVPVGMDDRTGSVPSVAGAAVPVGMDDRTGSDPSVAGAALPAEPDDPVGSKPSAAAAALLADTNDRTGAKPLTVGAALFPDVDGQSGSKRPVGYAVGALVLAAAAETAVGATGVSLQFGLGLWLLAAATTLPLAFLRPTAAAVAVTAASALSLGFFHTLTAAGLATLLIALYRSRSDLTVALAVPFLPLALADPSVLTVLAASLAPAAALTGIARRAHAEVRTHRAAREAIAGTLLDHTARGERARIARELHDVVAHHISMIAVQAETARLTTPGLPAAGAARLTEIGDTARAGLTEMRRLLGVLREDTDPPDRHPQPGLHQLNDLVDAARAATAAGTRLILRGPPVPLDPGVELAAYRIIQEALTNARRHAPGAAVDVELHYTADALRVRIRDNGPGPGEGPPTGHGLPGMRERVAAVGGHLHTGPAAGGGFLVEAALPAGVTA